MRKSALFLVSLLVACSGSSSTDGNITFEKPVYDAEVSAKAEVPKRIIVFIGDGMGIPYVAAGAYANDGPLNMMTMPKFAWMTTHEHEYVGTDSAASATAMATGQKTHFTGVSVKAGTKTEDETKPETHLKSIMEWAQELDLGTGMVATSRIVHATPAAFGAHRSLRKSYEGVAEDLSSKDFNVLLGAGKQYFTQRKDERDLLHEMEERGYAIALDPAHLEGVTSDKVAGLFYENDMPFILDEKRAMSLPDMTKWAIEHLDRVKPEGYVLMVEGSFIDWCGHNLNGACSVEETLDFDNAVGVGLDYARKRDDTLVVVTADHETGGLSVVDPYYAERFSTVLGGEAQMRAMAALKKPQKGAGYPIEHFAVGARRGIEAPSVPMTRSKWGMTENRDARFTMSWGHLSIASRPYFDGERRYYGAHTVTMVPLFAEGPGADFVAKSRDNADLGANLISLVKSRRNNSPEFTKANDKPFKPKNVVLMIGDGMGVPSVTAATYLNGATTMATFPVQGFASTHAIDYLVNDSAAGATALATGMRTRKRVAGMVVKDAALQPGTSVIDAAEPKQIRTGIVTTTQLVHATPASFYADVDHRRKKWDIAKHFVSFKRRTNLSDGIDVVVAGGLKDFNSEHQKALVNQGYQIRKKWDPTPTEGNLLMFVADEGLPTAGERKASGGPNLGEMTQYALNHLASEGEPFFLLVEGGQIDWELHHAKRDMSVVDEVVDFDGAVGVAKAFAENRGDTLVVVTADHDHTMSLLDTHYPFQEGMCGVEKSCGGPYEAIRLPIAKSGIPHGDGLYDAAMQGEYAPTALIMQYAWFVQAGMEKDKELDAPHSANFVPVFAYGPWATKFAGMNDQPEIGQIILEWVAATKVE